MFLWLYLFVSLGLVVWKVFSVFDKEFFIIFFFGLIYGNVYKWLVVMWGVINLNLWSYFKICVVFELWIIVKLGGRIRRWIIFEEWRNWGMF